MSECTWTLQRKQPLNASLKLVKRLQYWHDKKHAKLQADLEFKQVLEAEECTFQPNPEKPISQVKSTEVYDRNLKWLKLKLQREKKAADDNYKAILRPLPNMDKLRNESPLEYIFSQARQAKLNTFCFGDLLEL